MPFNRSEFEWHEEQPNFGWDYRMFTIYDIPTSRSMRASVSYMGDAVDADALVQEVITDAMRRLYDERNFEVSPAPGPYAWANAYPDLAGSINMAQPPEHHGDLNRQPRPLEMSPIPPPKLSPQRIGEPRRRALP
jgi:hypothetical protein